MTICNTSKQFWCLGLGSLQLKVIYSCGTRPEYTKHGGKKKQVMHLSSRIDEEKCLYSIHGHSSCSQSPFRQFSRALSTHTSISGSAQWHGGHQTLPRSSGELYCLQTAQQLPHLADGVEGRVNMHGPSTAGLCTEA